MESEDWYERRDELEEGQIFKSGDDSIVKLDRRVAGDGTKWFVLSWYPGIPNVPGYERGHWSACDGTIEPGDITERLPDDWDGNTPAGRAAIEEAGQ